MAKIARYARAQARPGKGGELSALLLTVADSLRATPGCELYMINQATQDPDTIWITEQWSDEASMKAALAAAAEAEDGPTPADAMALVEPGQWEMTELRPLGGVGPDVAATGHAKVNLDAVADMAPQYGMDDVCEARFANEDLGVGPTGISLQRIKPGQRQSFAHRHRRDEEVYVVLAGSGRMKIGDDVLDLGPLDAVRVGPEEVRAFEGGDDGLDLIAFGQRHRGDAEVLPGWWA